VLRDRFAPGPRREGSAGRAGEHCSLARGREQAHHVREPLLPERFRHAHDRAQGMRVRIVARIRRARQQHDGHGLQPRRGFAVRAQLVAGPVLAFDFRDQQRGREHLQHFVRFGGAAHGDHLIAFAAERRFQRLADFDVRVDHQHERLFDFRLLGRRGSGRFLLLRDERAAAGVHDVLAHADSERDRDRAAAVGQLGDAHDAPGLLGLHRVRHVRVRERDRDFHARGIGRVRAGEEHAVARDVERGGDFVRAVLRDVHAADADRRGNQRAAAATAVGAG